MPDDHGDDKSGDEYRSMGAVVTQFLSDAQHGAGWTTGAALVAGAAKKINDVLPGKDDSQEQEKQ